MGFLDDNDDDEDDNVSQQRPQQHNKIMRKQEQRQRQKTTPQNIVLDITFWDYGNIYFLFSVASEQYQWHDGISPESD